MSQASNKKNQGNSTMTPPMNYMKRRIIILLVVVFYLLCLFFARRLKMDEKITAMLPDNDPAIIDFCYMLDHIPATEILYVDIYQNKKNGPEHHFQRAADQVHEELIQSGFFTDVIYRFSNENFMNLLDLFSRKKFALLTSEELSKIETELTPDHIRRKLAMAKRKLLDPSGVFLVDQIRRDPLGWEKSLLAKLSSLKNEVQDIQIQGGRMVSHDQQHILIMAKPNFSAMETEKSVAFIAFLNGLRDKIEEQYGISLGFSGNHVATYDNSKAIKEDVQQVLFVLSVGIICIGILFFRNWYFVVLIFLPTLVSLTFASAFVSIFYHKVSAVSLGCGAVLVGITVDFAIHILFLADNRQEHIQDLIQEVKLPVLASAMTTMTAFGCLMTSSLPGQRQMGLFSMIGVAGAAFFSLYLLGYFIPEKRSCRKKALISLVTFIKAFLIFRKNYFRQILAVCLGLLILGLLGLKDFNLDGDLSNLNHLSPRVKADQDRFLAIWGDSSPTLALVQAEDLNSALTKNDHLLTLLLEMAPGKVVDSISSISPIFPSPEIRQKRLTTAKKFLAGKTIQEMRRVMEETTVKLGFSDHVFTPFYHTLSSPDTSLSVDDFKNTVLEKLITGKVIFKENRVLILTTFKPLKQKSIPDIFKKIKSELPDTMLMDRTSLTREITENLTRQFSKLFLFAGVGMILSISLLMGRVKVMVVTVLPVFLSIVITAGILGLIQIPINLISMIFIVFVFGVGIDFSIFLVNSEQWSTEKSGEEFQAVTHGAILICAMTTIGGFISLCFADHQALHSIGVAGTIGMLTSLVTALVLVPGLAKKWLKGDKNHG